MVWSLIKCAMIYYMDLNRDELSMEFRVRLIHFESNIIPSKSFLRKIYNISFSFSAMNLSMDVLLVAAFPWRNDVMKNIIAKIK